MNVSNTTSHFLDPSSIDVFICSAQCLNLLLVGSKKIWIPQKWCSTTYIDSLGYSNSNFIFRPIFVKKFGQFLCSEGLKTAKKSKLLIFHDFSFWIFFCTQFFPFFFLSGNHIYWEFFYLKKTFIKKKKFQLFFKKIPLVPPMDVFSSFGGPRVVAADLSCSRVASVHCDFVGVCGGAVFWPEKDFLKRVESCLGEVLTRLSYIS